MSGGDLVNLVIVSIQNHLHVQAVTRTRASGHMREWYAARDAVHNKTEGWEKCADWLHTGTLAFNYELKDGGSVCNMTVGLEHVVGMYVVEIDRSNIQNRIVSAQEELLKVVKKTVDEGEGWRGNDDNDFGDK